MAATNPFRVSDLIKKYGWTIMPYLSNLGPQLLAEAQILFVDSGHTNALDADDTEHGHSFERPLATWDYAIGLCTAGEKSVIFLAPGHNENLGDAQITHDINDVVTIGIGDGPNKPRIDFGNANSSIDISANNVVIRNVNVMPAVTQVLIGIHVMTGATGCKLVDVDFLMGEDGAGVDEFIKAMELTSGNHDTVFENVRILAHASAAHATHGIDIAAASDRLIFRNVIIHGPYTNGIKEAAAGKNHIVEDCSVDVTSVNFGFDNASTFAKFTRNVDAGVDSEESEPLIEVARGTGTTPTGITDNSILAYLMGSGATASASTYNNTTMSLQALATAIAAINNTVNLKTAVDAPAVARSIQDILEKDGQSGYDDAYHSLEAIGDRLIDAGVDELMSVADGTDPRPASVVNDSVLAMIMGKGDPATVATYDNTTDSLEAISEAIATLDTGVTSAVAATPTASSVQDILQKDATQDYNRATDSLEALSDKFGGFTMDGGADQNDSVKASLDLAHTDLDAILADTITISGATLPASPTADSLARFVASGGTALGQQLPDSMSLIDIIGNYTGAYDGASAGNNVKADIDLAKTEIDKIVADVGDFSARTNLQTLLAVLGNPDTSGYTSWSNIKSIHTTAIDGSSNPVANTLSDILHKDGNYTFDNTSDSLEAIADSLIVAIGSPAAGSALDILKKLHYVADGTDAFPATVADDSVLAKIMGVGDPASVSTFDNTTDSLQAIRDYIAGTTALDAINLDHLCLTGTGVAADGELDGHITAQSILGHIMATDADPSSYNATSDSLQAIGADADAILADTAAMAERTVEKSDGAVLTGDDDIFDISGGPILVTNLVGIVTTLIGGASNLSIIETSTQPGGDVNLSTTVAIDNDAQGTSYSFTAAVPSVLTPTTAGTLGNVVSPGWLCPIGTIKAKGSAAQSGVIKWYLTYKPLSPSSAVAASA